MCTFATAKYVHQKEAREYFTAPRD